MQLSTQATIARINVSLGHVFNLPTDIESTAQLITESMSVEHRDKVSVDLFACERRQLPAQTTIVTTIQLAIQ